MKTSHVTSITLSSLLISCDSPVEPTPSHDVLEAEKKPILEAIPRSHKPVVAHETTEPESSTVYDSLTIKDAHGRIVRTDVQGTIDDHVYQRAARPWTYLDEPYLYHEDAWVTINEDGSSEHRYRITRAVNLQPVVAAVDRSPIYVSGELEQLIQAAAPEDLIEVLVKFRDFPAWNIPLRPDPTLLSAAEVKVSLARYDDALLARDALLDERVERDLGEFLAARGTVKLRFPGEGWVTVEGTRRAVIGLRSRPGLAAIALTNEGAIKPAWALGETREGEKVDADQLISAGITGQIANPGRHSYGRIVVGDVEPSTYEDEACAFFDGANCTGASRIVERYECVSDNNPADGVLCESTTNHRDDFFVDAFSSHATITAAIIGADYTDGQGCGEALGDLDWMSAPPPVKACHHPTWANEATGMAPEVGLALAGDITNTAPGLASAFNVLAAAGVDIVNGSLGYDHGENVNPVTKCNPKAITIVDEAVENAFDSGVFVVIAPGNDNNGLVGQAAGQICNLESPGDSIKSFAVNAYDAGDPDCQTFTHDWCMVEKENSVTGGGAATINGITYNGVLSMVDMIAPVALSMITGPTGSRGTVTTSAPTGTSMASPVVAGLAALVKHWYLSLGLTWINNPGRLHVAMLAMGDRRYSTDPNDPNVQTFPRVNRADQVYGLGRPTLRMLGATSQWFASRSFTGPSPWTPSVGVPLSILPAGTNLVKCVLLQVEDMTAPKVDISDIDLKLLVYSPLSGSCAAASGTPFSRNDTSRDAKSMVAITSEDTTLAGKCVQVQIEPYHVSSAGITVEVMCYRSGLLDHEF